MKKIPPHLPNPACSIVNHNRFMRLKLFIISIVAGLSAGLVGAMVMINAWYPTANTTVVVPNRNTTPSLDSSVVRDWRPRLITIYDESKTVSKEYYLNTARVATAVVVNAGGWAVLPLTKINKTNFVGLDYQGQTLRIEEVVTDENLSLTFIKLSGADFRATASFAERSVLQTGRVLWGFNTDWQPYRLGQTYHNPRAVQNGLVVSVAIDPVLYPIEDFGSENRVLITDRGEFVGFTNSARIVTPVWMVGQVLPRLASGQKPALLSFNWQGTFVEARRSEQGSVDGFLVTDSVPASVVKKGDVVITIDGQKVTPENLTALLTFAPAEFSVTVERNKILTDLIIKK